MPRTDTKESVSTVAVDKAIMDRVRATAKKNGITTVDLTNQLLTYALDHGKVEISVKKVAITVAPAAPASSRRK